jgi:hypothetical protein
MTVLLLGALAFLHDIADLAATSWLYGAVIVAIVLAAYGEAIR